MTSNIYYVIVSYNGEKQIVNLVNSLKGFNLLVVDNASADNSIEQLKKENLPINIFRNKKNIGYGPAANKAIRQALRKGAEWVVVLNQDMQVSKNVINEFNKKLGHLSPGIVGPFKGTLDKKRYTTIFEKQNHSQADYISGAFIAIHKEVVRKIGYFFEPYFMYYEDVDYCIRAKKFFPIHHLKLKKVIHLENSSLGMRSFLHQYYLSRNHLLFVHRWAPMKVRVYELLRLPKTIWEHFYRKEKGALFGVKDYLLLRYGKY